MHENIFLHEKAAESPISRLSAVSSGWSPITLDGKSKIGILKHKKSKRIFNTFYIKKMVSKKNVCTNFLRMIKLVQFKNLPWIFLSES